MFEEPEARGGAGRAASSSRAARAGKGRASDGEA